MSSGVTASYRGLLGRLKTYVVKDWFASSEQEFPDVDRVAADLREADVVSSELKDKPGFHIVAVDIDYPAHLVESSTPGHYHLYLDVPGGIEKSAYIGLLRQLARVGVIEDGYAQASSNRGHSDLRLPWVGKPAEVEKAPTPIPFVQSDIYDF